MYNFTATTDVCNVKSGLWGLVIQQKQLHIQSTTFICTYVCMCLLIKWFLSAAVQRTCTAITAHGTL